MKKSLIEELERIHSISYGLVNEGFLDSLANRIASTFSKKETEVEKIDDPKKADLVSDDVKEFFSNLESIKSPLNQQQRGSMSFQKDVETMQIGLILLGYDLPKYGVDGLYGPETAAAVKIFANENSIKKLDEVNIVPSGSLIGKPGQGTHNASDWQSRNAWDVKSPVGTKVLSITNGTVVKNRKASGGLKRIGNKKIYGDQVSVKSNDGKPDIFYTHIDSNLGVGSEVKVGDVIGTIIDMKGIPSHVHVGLSHGNLSDLVDNLPSANGGSGSSSKSSGLVIGSSTFTPDMAQKMLSLLKERGVTSEELKELIDTKVTMTSGGGGEALTSDSDFEEITTAVIDNLEGGYYHPVAHNSSGMGDSGETMMGIDRKHGGTINTDATGQEFWSIIDNADAKNKWRWNYKGGPLEGRLKSLVVKMIAPRYEKYTKSYMSPEASNLVNQSVVMRFHFIYAVWNGPGWFQTFAKKLNSEVASGNKDIASLERFVMDTRKQSSNRIIARGGRKIENLLSKHFKPEGQKMA